MASAQPPAIGIYGQPMKHHCTFGKDLKEYAERAVAHVQRALNCRRVQFGLAPLILGGAVIITYAIRANGQITFR